MKKAIIVEYSFITRIVLDEKEENIETVIAKSRAMIMEKAKNDLADNLSEWYDDEEMPYNSEEE
ncbi:MAG: hypothetical protein ACJARG_000061 [Arcticibacterium sp.]|jgi:hypothetical protein